MEICNSVIKIFGENLKNVQCAFFYEDISTRSIFLNTIQRKKNIYQHWPLLRTFGSKVWNKEK